MVGYGHGLGFGRGDGHRYGIECENGEPGALQLPQRLHQLVDQAVGLLHQGAIRSV